MSARVVRRAPLLERISSYLNPLDFWLWASEELNSQDWDEFNNDWSALLGAGLNLVFVLARANSEGPTDDAIFDDDRVAATGWLAWLVCCSRKETMNRL